MAEVTGIAWTDATFNPWIGCTKVGPGCDHCYAEALDKRHRWQGDTHWGAGKPRMLTSESNWRKPLTWQRNAENGISPDGKTWINRSPRVFCASLADVFDNEVPEAWRADLWRLIRATPALTWLLLTKRIGNTAKMIGDTDNPMQNVWIGATIVNAEEAERDVPKLLVTPAAKRFVSYEPALGPVDWTKYPGVDWIIIGGESTQGAKARPFAIEWARWTIRQCKAAGVPVFMKQVGSDFGHCGPDGVSASPIRYPMKDRAGADPAEWPEDLRVREFPRVASAGKANP